MLYNITQEGALSFGSSQRRAPCPLESPMGARAAFRNCPQVRAPPFGISHRRAPGPLESPMAARPALCDFPQARALPIWNRPQARALRAPTIRSSARTCPVSTPNAGHARGALVLGRNAQLQHGPPDCSPLGNPKNVSRLGKTLIFEELWSSAGTCAASVPHAWHKGSALLPRRNAHSPRAPRLATARISSFTSFQWFLQKNEGAQLGTERRCFL